MKPRFHFTRTATIPLCLLFALQHTSATERTLESSIDAGETWQPHSKPREWAPATGLLRLTDTPTPLLQLPACALTAATLEVTIWTLQADNTPFALTWTSKACNPSSSNTHHVDGDNTTTCATATTVDTTTISTRVQKPVYRKPEWTDYVHARMPPGGDGAHGDGAHGGAGRRGKKQGFFGKYGLYIMAFIGFALAHGIRNGLRELHAETEREEAAAEARRHKRQNDQSSVVVQRSRKASRARKRSASKSAAK